MCRAYGISDVLWPIYYLERLRFRNISFILNKSLVVTEIPIEWALGPKIAISHAESLTCVFLRDAARPNFQLSVPRLIHLDSLLRTKSANSL